MKSKTKLFKLVIAIEVPHLIGTLKWNKQALYNYYKALKCMILILLYNSNFVFLNVDSFGAVPPQDLWLLPSS